MIKSADQDKLNTLCPGDIYLHHTGKKYEIIATSTLLGYGTAMVTYKSLQNQSVWTRPIDAFFANAIKGSIDDHEFDIVPKFKKI